MSLEIIIAEQLDLIIKELIEQHDKLGMRTSGKWVDSLEQQTDGNNGKILGEPYTEQLTKGRLPGKRPPISPIEDWVKLKFGLSGKQATSAAFAVATKIGKEGTTWFEKGGSDLIDGVLTDTRIRQMIENIGVQISAEIAVEMRRNLKQQ